MLLYELSGQTHCQDYTLVNLFFRELHQSLQPMHSLWQVGATGTPWPAVTVHFLGREHRHCCTDPPQGTTSCWGVECDRDRGKVLSSTPLEQRAGWVLGMMWFTVPPSGGKYSGALCSGERRCLISTARGEIYPWARAPGGICSRSSDALRAAWFGRIQARLHSVWKKGSEIIG